MTRWDATKHTAGALVVIGIFAYVLDRWPLSTMAGITVASIYRGFREQPKAVARDDQA